MVEACNLCKDIMEKGNVSIELYGPERQGFKRQYKELIQEKKLTSVMRVVDGEGLFGIDKENVLCDADFFIMTSRFEGMPMAMIEALSYGLPCIATRGTNMGEIINACSAGFGCETNANSIAENLIKMINQKEKLKLMSEQAIQLANRYDWNSIAENSHGKYLKIVENHNK